MDFVELVGDYSMSDLLTPPQIAEMLQVDRSTVVNWCKSGKLRAFRAGERGRWRIHRADLEAFVKYNQEVQEQERQPPGRPPKARGLAVAY